MRWLYFAAALAAGAGALAPLAARGAEVLAATYDLPHDELVFVIEYRGTMSDHEFSLLWGECDRGMPHPIVARVQDANWRDPAFLRYQVRARFSLAELPCRPALVTIGIAGGSFATLYVPGRNEFRRAAR